MTRPDLIALDATQVRLSADLRASLAASGLVLDMLDGEPRVYGAREVAPGLDATPRLASYVVARRVQT